MRVGTWLVLAGSLAPVLPAGAQEAQTTRTCGADTVINVYRYVLDLEPPESPALAVLGATTSHSRSATAPKPLALSAAVLTRGSSPALAGAALDVSPYFLVGGGARSLCSYRDNSVAGRMKRVGTKTIISVGVLPLRGGSGAMRFGAAVRATLHDPHDPINNSALVRRLPVTSPGDELPPPADDGAAEYEAAGRAMQARDRWIVSAGWGAAATLVDGTFARVADGWRHALWLSWQRTLDARFDLLFTGEAALQRGASPAYRASAAARRKLAAADLLLETTFDTGDERLHGGASAEARVAPRVRAALGILTEPGAGPGARGRTVRAAATLRWTAGY